MENNDAAPASMAEAEPAAVSGELPTSEPSPQSGDMTPSEASSPLDEVAPSEPSPQPTAEQERQPEGSRSTQTTATDQARTWLLWQWLASQVRTKRWYLAAVGGAVTVAVVTSLLVGAAASPFALTSRPRPATPTSTPVYPYLEVQSEIDAEAEHNAALGCAPNAPTPLPGVLYGGNYRGSPLPAPMEVALTFDDGPTPASTPTILSILERSRTLATFFVEGQYVTQYPDLLRREWNDGFAIANHSWDHPMMAHLGSAALAHQFGDTDDAIHRILGSDACLWLYRPPYANYNPLVLQAAQSFGLSTITWDDGSLDWAVPRPTPQQIAHQVLVALHPGAVILMHDGPSRHPNTEAALPLVIQELVVRGYLPVTLPRLLADMHYPGVTATGPLPPMPTVPPDLLRASDSASDAVVAPGPTITTPE